MFQRRLHKAGLRLPRIVVFGHVRAALREQGYVADAKGTTSSGNMEWGLQLSPETYEPR